MERLRYLGNWVSFQSAPTVDCISVHHSQSGGGKRHDGLLPVVAEENFVR